MGKRKPAVEALAVGEIVVVVAFVEIGVDSFGTHFELTIGRLLVVPYHQ